MEVSFAQLASYGLTYTYGLTLIWVLYFYTKMTLLSLQQHCHKYFSHPYSGQVLAPKGSHLTASILEQQQ